MLNYDCPYRQVISYDMLRIVMIGYAKFEVRWAIIAQRLRSKFIMASIARLITLN